MRSSNPNALLDYITTNRSRLDIKEFKKLLENKDLDVNAQDKDGNTALHLLVTGGGRFEYAQLLLRFGADIGIQNQKLSTVLDIVLTQKQQPQLLLLIAAQYKKLSQEFPIKWAENLELKDVVNLLNFQFPTDNQFGEIFRKIIDNGCNFNCLDEAEIGFLKQCQKEISEEGLDLDKSGSDTDSLPSPKKPPLTFGLTDEKMIDLAKKFITNFGPIINTKFVYENSKAFVMDEENTDLTIVALRNYLTNQTTISDLLTILKTQAEPDLTPKIIKPILETIDYEELDLACSQKQASAMIRTVLTKRVEVKDEVMVSASIHIPPEIADKISGFLDAEEATEVARSIDTILRPRASARNIEAQRLQAEAQLTVGE